MLNAETYCRMVQNLQVLYEQHFITPQLADQFLMSAINGYGSLSMLLNQNCGNYGFWLNNGLIPQKATTFDNYGGANALHLSKQDIRTTVQNYILSTGRQIRETKTLSTIMPKHACEIAGIIHLEPQYLMINQIKFYHCVVYYYCEHCHTLYVLDDTMTPIGISIPFESIFRKHLTVQNISQDFNRMELIANQRMFFSNNAQRFANGAYTMQSISPALSTLQAQGMLSPMTYAEVEKLIYCGNSVKKVFDTMFADYVDKMNGNLFPFRRTRFDNEGNAQEVHYTTPEKIIGIANNIQANGIGSVTSVMKLGESAVKHACKVRGVVKNEEKPFTYFNGQGMETIPISFCPSCGLLMYVDGESQYDSIDDTPEPNGN